MKQLSKKKKWFCTAQKKGISPPTTRPPRKIHIVDRQTLLYPHTLKDRRLLKVDGLTDAQHGVTGPCLISGCIRRAACTAGNYSSLLRCCTAVLRCTVLWRAVLLTDERCCATDYCRRVSRSLVFAQALGVAGDGGSSGGGGGGVVVSEVFVCTFSTEDKIR